MIYLFYCILFFLFSCDNPLTNEEDKNCILDLGGFYDDCGVCVGGITNTVPNSSKDCNGECFGESEFDNCGICNGDNTDCDSLSDNFCNLDSGEFWDECGNCIGVNDIENELMDDCGVCFSDQSLFDQSANILKDLCGICNGNNTSCDYGLLTLSEWSFSQLKLWNNDNCYGTPYHIMNDYICLDNESLCFNYSINLEPDYELGIFVFMQTVSFTDGTQVILDGQWFLNTIDCGGVYLDYNDTQYQDGCYNDISIQNTYNDCISDLSLCTDNVISLLNVNQENETCSLEIFNKDVSLTMHSNILPNDIFSYLPFYLKNIFTYIDNSLNR